MRDVRMLAGVGVVAAMLACAVGEVPPGEPTDVPPLAEEPREPVGGAVDEAAAARASELLTRSQVAYESGQVDEALRLARRVLTDYPGLGVEASARWVAAQAAFAMGRYEEARELALEHATAQGPAESAADARMLAELAEDAQAAPADVAVVGAVLPRSGPRVLVRYGDWVLEGIELAVAAAERAQNRRIELVVADDEGGARLHEAVRELERRGAVAIVGPLLAQQVQGAAWARNNERRVLVSPTSPEVPGATEAYTLNSNDPRGAQALGRYAAEVGLKRAAVLYPRITEFERKAQAFSMEFEALGGEVRAMVPFDSGTTTFAAHMERILAAVGRSSLTDSQGSGLVGEWAESGAADAEQGQPFALFVPAPVRDVRQLAPQLSFYGLVSAGVQVFGDEAWASSDVRRLVPQRDLEGVIAASRFPPERADAAADPAFVEAYEGRYRRSLENELPALGYDAAHLIVQALPNRMLTPEAFAWRFHLLAGIRGATGLLSVRANRVVRTPYLVFIRGGELEPAPSPWEYEMPEPRPVRGAATRNGGGQR